MNGNTNTKAWIITSAVVGIVLILAAIFFYHNFFRQTKAPLIETVPADAAFVFEINDNEEFVKSSASLIPYLTDLFALDGLAGFESFLEKVSKKDEPILVSGFVEDDIVVPVFSTRMDEHYFKNLLKLLQIDPRNNIKFEECEIYAYGTHYKDFKFVFHNNIFSVSEDVELLKKTIVQLKYPKGLTNDKSFGELHKLVEKNVKQNWLLINPTVYIPFLASKTDESLQSFGESIKEMGDWCAYQLRFTDDEMFLSGYVYTDDPKVLKYADAKAAEEFPQRVVPVSAMSMTIVDNANQNAMLEYFKKDNSLEKSDPVNDYQRISPLQSIFFSLPGDSVTYHYCALKLDTLKASFASFFPDSVYADSILRTSTNGIYPCDAVNFAGLFSTKAQNDEYRYFMPVKDYFILADTTSSLEHYKAVVKNENFIESSNVYRFAASNTPSDAVFTFVFLNNDETLGKYMNRDYAKKSSMNALKVMVFSHAVPDKKMVSCNIYMKF